MNVFEERLVGENHFEETVIRNIVLQELLCAVQIADFKGANIGEPGETGIMALEAKWECGALECDVWVEICTGCAGSEAIRCGDFHLTLGWRTAEDEGYWDTLDEIIQWDVPVEHTECEDLHLEVAR